MLIHSIDNNANFAYTRHIKSKYFVLTKKGLIMTTNNRQKDKSFTIRVDADLLKTFQTVAKENDRPSAQLIRDFMREYIKKNKQGELKF